jgi:glutamate-ammonia-ligase adenylyltransferase
MRPRETLAGRLAALGFADTDGAQRILTEELQLDVDGADADLVAALAAAADPDQALTRLGALGTDDDLLQALRADQGLRARLIAVLGVSAALADHLRRTGGCWNPRPPTPFPPQPTSPRSCEPPASRARRRPTRSEPPTAAACSPWPPVT